VVLFFAGSSTLFAGAKISVAGTRTLFAIVKTLCADGKILYAYSRVLFAIVKIPVAGGSILLSGARTLLYCTRSLRIHRRTPFIFTWTYKKSGYFN